MRILVIEDDRTNQKLIEAYLEQFGDCVLAGGGIEGVQKFTEYLEQHTPFDLVCIDIMMPDMDGVTTLKKIRETEAAHDKYGSNESKILMITAVVDKNIVVDAFKLGCEGYLVKPIQREELLRHMRQLGFDLKAKDGKA